MNTDIITPNYVRSNIEAEARFRSLWNADNKEIIWTDMPLVSEPDAWYYLLQKAYEREVIIDKSVPAHCYLIQPDAGTAYIYAVAFVGTS